VVSFFVLVQFKRFDYRRLNQPLWALAPLGVVLGLLLVVWFADPRRHRWLDLGPASLQPSEFAKPALIIFLAWFISMRLRAINNKYTLMPAVLATSVLGAVVVIADLGTAVVLVATAAGLFFVAGLDKRYLMAALTAGMLIGALAVLAKPYRLARVVAFVDPDFTMVDKIDKDGKLKEYMRRSRATRDPGYQELQSRIAVGSGGVVGAGLAEGRQKLLYLPEAHTDFIYAVVGEELGLWGSTGILAGFLVIFWRGLRLFWLAPDTFGRYLALGITVSIVVQALINMSVVIGIAPTKGIPLPMISYGGSSLLSSLISLGILLSVSEHSG
jgi:cell division protein FtsW